MTNNKLLQSKVEGFEGLCRPVWLDTSELSFRLFTNYHVTGFFKLVRKHWLFGYVKTGKQFHGYITSKGEVKTTEGIYNSYQFE